MGQKVHPTGYRLGTIEPWRSRWYASKKDYGRLLLSDKKVRDYIHKEFASAGIARVEIERTGEAVNVVIYTARPGVLVGRKGVRVDALKGELQAMTGMTCHLTLHEIKRPELESVLVAEVIAEALVKRMAFRRAIKRAIQTTMQSGALGIKVEVNGRLGGAEMARTAKEREGRVPPFHASVTHRLRHGASAHDLRNHRCEGLDLQRRHRARQAHRSSQNHECARWRGPATRRTSRWTRRRRTKGRSIMALMPKAE